MQIDAIAPRIMGAIFLHERRRATGVPPLGDPALERRTERATACPTLALRRAARPPR